MKARRSDYLILAAVFMMMLGFLLAMAMRTDGVAGFWTIFALGLALTLCVLSILAEINEDSRR